MQNKKIKIILIVILAGFIIGTISATCFENHYLYCSSDYYFQDYKDTISITDNVYGGISGGRGYFPFTYVVLKIIEFFFRKNVIGFIFTFSIFLYFLVRFYEIYFKEMENKKKLSLILVLMICSYPLMFEFIQANVEYILLSFVLLFFICYKKEKFTLASILLACAICMKLYPAVFVILLLKKKKYKEFILCIVLSITLTLCSFVIMGGNINNLPIAVGNFRYFNELYAINNYGLPCNHTIWAMIRWFNMDNLVIFSRGNISIYTLAILMLSLIIVAYLLFIEKEEWKIITILTIMMISFPHISFDYTLLHLYIPITYFIVTENKKKWEVVLYAILLGLCIIPINYIKITAYEFTFYIGTVVKPIMFILIIGTMMYSGIKRLIKGKSGQFTKTLITEME